MVATLTTIVAIKRIGDQTSRSKRWASNWSGAFASAYDSSKIDTDRARRIAFTSSGVVAMRSRLRPPFGLAMRLREYAMGARHFADPFYARHVTS